MRSSTYCKSARPEQLFVSAQSSERAEVKILLLSRYGSRGASSRLRTRQFLPYLRRNGFAVSVNVLLDDDYVDGIYTGRRPSIVRIALAYARRVNELLRDGDFDLLWLEREALPWFLAALELRLLKARDIPYVLELDDAVFHRYSDHRFAPVRFCLGNKIEQLMKKSALVIAGSEYIAQRAVTAGAPWVELVPTVVDMERYLARPLKHDQFRIGWIGSPATVHFLKVAAKALKEFSRRHSDVQLVVVGANRAPVEGIETVTVDWTEATEGQEVANMDVGIMPLSDGPFERGKCGYKLIQYMAASVPVIASPVGSNRTIVQDGRTGFLAADDAEWVDRLELLYRDPELRRSMGAAGRMVAARSYSLEVTAPRIAHLLRCAAKRRAT